MWDKLLPIDLHNDSSFIVIFCDGSEEKQN